MRSQPKRSKQEWMSLFEQQQKSGMTIRAFCQKHELNYQTFMARRSDLKRNWASHNAKAGISHSTQLVKLERRKKQSQNTVTLKHGNSELHIHNGHDVAYLVSLIKALNA